MARDAVVTGGDIVVAGRGSGKVVLTLVVNDDDRIAIRIVHAVQCGTERGDAQHQQEQTRGVAHQLWRQPQLFLHHCRE